MTTCRIAGAEALELGSSCAATAAPDSPCVDVNRGAGAADANNGDSVGATAPGICVSVSAIGLDGRATAARTFVAASGLTPACSGGLISTACIPLSVSARKFPDSGRATFRACVSALANTPGS